ncbi:MAG: helix-turn-helix transcriptional regulator [Chloroflexota bacterium]
MARHVIQNRLRELMAAKGRRENRTITQSAVSKETGLARHTVDRWARNEVVRMDDTTLIALCVYFGCQPGDLLIMVEQEESGEIAPEYKTPALVAH